MALSDNLVSWWKFNESSGNAADSVGSNTGTPTHCSYGACKINNGIILGGYSDSKVDFGNNSSLNLTGAMTINLWFKSGGYANYSLIEKANAYKVYTSSSNAGVSFYSSGEKACISATAIDTDSWVMVTMVYDGSGTLSVYVNGSSVGSQSRSGTIATNTNNLILGNTNRDARFDEVGIWSRALSGTEITTLYNSGNGITYPFSTAYTLAMAYTTFSLTGKAVTLVRGFKLVLAYGAFVLTGIAVALKKGYKIVAAYGSFALTGVQLLFNKTLKMAFSVGNFTLTGIAIVLAKGKTLTLGFGTFTVTGFSTLFNIAVKIVLSTGNFTLTGIAITIKKGYNISLEYATYAVTGINVAFKVGLKIIASCGSFTITGINIILGWGRKIALSFGSFSLTGQSINFRKTLKMIASTGFFSLIGFILGFRTRTRYTRESKPTTIYTKENKISTNYTKENKVTTSYTKETKL